MSEWQSMETAPKDGQLVLLCTKNASKFQGYFAAYWNRGWEEWKFHTEGYVRNPVAWMPIPEAPPLSVHSYPQEE